MPHSTRVTVVIPHYNGREILAHCLESLRKTTFEDYEILLVDNGSSDGSGEMVEAQFPEVRVVRSELNLGFAAGCNLGIRSSTAPYVVLLNNDTEVTPDWLTFLVQAADEDPNIAAVQPKILSFQNRKQFDYAGAAGGELDILGYPFARGRLFETVEEDNGQYDSPSNIFWASGAATLLRREALNRVGLLESDFFAHMEEIDLNWRFHWAGYRIVSVPDAVIYHQTGGTLGQASFRKMVLNHRNNLLMLLRNLSVPTLCWVMPLRLLLEFVTMGFALVTGKPQRAVAVLWGLGGVIRQWNTVLAGRHQVASIRNISEETLLHRMYRDSIAGDYFLKGIRRTLDLSKFKKWDSEQNSNQICK